MKQYTKISAILNLNVTEILTLDDDYPCSDIYFMPTTFESPVVFAFSDV